MERRVAAHDPFARLKYGVFAPKVRHTLDPKWERRAACKGQGLTQEGIARWFPGPGGAQGGKEVCATCPVIRECGKFADDEGIEWGIWGGEIRRRKTKGEEQ